MSRTIVGVDGRDGSGKSFLADSLTEAAAGDALLIRVDDFRRSVDWSASADEAETYYESYYDFSALDDVISSFSRGDASGSVPVFDSVAEAVTGSRRLAFDRAHVLVVEGVLIRRVAAMAGAVHIYVRTSEEEARRRIAGRDLRKGRTAAEVARRTDQRYFPAQRRYHLEHDPEGSAAVVIDHEQLGQPQTIRCDLDNLPRLIRIFLETALPDGPHGTWTR